MDEGDLEGIADDVLGEIGLDEPIDAFDLVELLDLPPVRWAPGVGGAFRGGEVVIGINTPVRQIHSSITHECAHMLLQEQACDSERRARYLGAALLVPRRSLSRQLRRGWDLEALRCVHVNASAELIARRVVEVREHASLAVYDGGRLRYRLGGRHALEHELVEEAMRRARPARVDDLTGAWPVFVDGWRRVLVLSARP